MAAAAGVDVSGSNQPSATQPNTSDQPATKPQQEPADTEDYPKKKPKPAAATGHANGNGRRAALDRVLS
jgi:hypothetical protein